jgi:hypothetical protein
MQRGLSAATNASHYTATLLSRSPGRIAPDLVVTCPLRSPRSLSALSDPLTARTVRVAVE